MKITLLVLVMLALPLSAAAQGPTIWRCGGSYSATPCGEGRALEPVASVSPADQQAAHQNVGRDQRLGDRMRNDRLRSEAASQRTALAGFVTTPPGPAVRAGSAKAKKHHPPEAAGTWRATAPASRRAKG